MPPNPAPAPGAEEDCSPRPSLRRSLCLDYVYDEGFTEDFSNAWFTQAARAKRALSPLAWGPWGAFATLARTPAGLRAALAFEVHLTISVGAGLFAIFALPGPATLVSGAIAVGSGLWAFNLLPQLEGLEEEYLFDLEPAS